MLSWSVNRLPTTLHIETNKEHSLKSSLFCSTKFRSMFQCLDLLSDALANPVCTLHTNNGVYTLYGYVFEWSKPHNPGPPIMRRWWIVQVQRQRTSFKSQSLFFCWHFNSKWRKAPWWIWSDKFLFSLGLRPPTNLPLARRGHKGD